jgi:hypothetical protein
MFFCINNFLYAAGPFLCTIFLMPQEEVCCTQHMIKPKRYDYEASLWPIEWNSIEQKSIKKKIPKALLQRGYAFTIPSFEGATHLSLYKTERVVIPSPEYSVFNIFEQPSSIPLVFNKQLTGSLNIFSATKHEVKISLTFVIPPYQVQLNELLPLNKWIVVDNARLTALIRINALIPS